MIQSILSKILENLGLDEKEAAIYLAGLELGPASVQRLAAVSRIKRTTVYLIAGLLKEKGLMSEFKGRRGVQYVPLQPDKLVGMLEERKAVIEEAVPELMALTKGHEAKPYVRFYEGREGVLSVLNDVLGCEDEELLFLGSHAHVFTYATPTFYQRVFMPTRLKRKIFLRALVIKEPRTMSMRARDEEDLREIRFLPPDADFVTSQYIYRDKIAYISPGREGMGLIVESRDLAAMERQKFRLSWEACRP